MRCSIIGVIIGFIPGLGGSVVDWIAYGHIIQTSKVRKRFGFYIGIILSVYLFIYLIGYPLTMTLFICLFYRLIAKAKWSISIVAGCAGFGFLAMTSHLLSMEWPEGLLKLPWPLG